MTTSSYSSSGTFTVPTTGLYDITAYGAQGGSGDLAPGGDGAEMRGEFSLTAGDVIKVVVGQAGANSTEWGGGGGGGSFVIETAGTHVGALLIAGGGGGGGYRFQAGSPGPGLGGTTSAGGIAGEGASGTGGAGGTAGLGGHGSTGGFASGGGGGLQRKRVWRVWWLRRH